MSTRIVTKPQWETFEQSSALAFLLGGVLFTLVVVSLIALGETVPEIGLELALVAVFVLVAVGMGGLRPKLQHRAARLTDVGTLGAAIAIVGALLALVMLAVVSVTGWNPGILELVIWMGTLAALALGFLAFGAAIWKTEAVKRITGGLLVAGGVFLLVYIANTILWELEVVALVMMVLWGLVLLGVGTALRTEPRPRLAERLEDGTA
ncbi:hypothetical protein [Natrarchaeobius chitinivorans]|uniref:DUF308 domain-containing protein n=1 Tax=Natrarchaeobius chitinivorans TaxID=1679083 RepID=A0A3N6MIA8_NATCH|nr:hypothetical protein [Natrarchaeobius chitinivorans]RQG93786.1 hypothetical protein EA473_13760 [Natrarchaeobius chitinivorans]